MYSIIYQSSAKDSFGIIEIYKMLSNARDNNEEKGITGCLLYHKKQFIQLLEGQKKEVLDLYDSILKDQRHSDVKTIAENDIDQPIFEDWSMAFHEFGDEKTSAHAKIQQIDKIFKKSAVFERPSEMALNFFQKVSSVLVEN